MARSKGVCFIMGGLDVNCVSGCGVDLSGLSSQMTTVISATDALQTQMYALNTMISATVPVFVYVATFNTVIGMLLAFYLINVLRRG